MLRDIEVKGRFTAARRVPATLDLPARAARCLEHFVENADPAHGYVPWLGATLGDEPPHFVHHRLDFTEILPYAVYGVPIIRKLTGATAGAEVQLAQRRLTLAHFTGLDGLVHPPVSTPWSRSYPLCLWEQARALYALLYWWWDSGEERLLAYAQGIVDGVFALSIARGRERTFPPELLRTAGMGSYGPGALIDPLVRWHEETGDGRALRLAEGLFHALATPGNGYFAEDGQPLHPSFRAATAVANGLSHLAALEGDPALLGRARQVHEALVARCTAFGATPCNEPACSGMELAMSALQLARAGDDAAWDLIDRFVRNQVTESQFLDPAERVAEKAVHGRRMNRSPWVTDHWPADLHILPFDDYRDVVRRSLGGFMWTTVDEHLFIPASLMLCCAAHAMRAFEVVWENALVEDAGRVTVNFLVNHASAAGTIAGWEPHQGRVDVVLNRAARLRVRVPEYALGAPLEATVAGAPRAVACRGRYAELGEVPAGAECVLRYPLRPRTTAERCVQQDAPDRNASFQARWRGNTVVELAPASAEPKAVYRRRHLDADEAPLAEVRHFIPDRPFRW